MADAPQQVARLGTASSLQSAPRMRTPEEAARTSSQVSGRSLNLLTEIDPELIRGVSLDTALGGWGQHWKTPDSGMFNVDPENYQLSRPVDNFMSHDWHTSRWLKVVSMLVIFNSKPAALATLLVSVLFGGIAIYAEFPRGHWLTIPGHASFFITFFFWQRIRRLFRPQITVFLDKLCIAQHDDKLKEQGILGLAAFLDRSKKLTIFWSPRYFSRLWCTYELATFLRDGKRKPIEFMPLAWGLMIFLESAQMHFQVLASRMLQAFAGSESGPVLLATGCVILIALVMLPFVAYVGIGLMRSAAMLPGQLQGFSIRNAECFCCSNNHRHPDTGAWLQCDRKLVFKTLRQWYGDDCEEGETFLDNFDTQVRNRLRDEVLQGVLGAGMLHLEYTLSLVYVVYLPFLSYWMREVARGPEEELAGWEMLGWSVKQVCKVAKHPIGGLMNMWLLVAACKVACQRLGVHPFLTRVPCFSEVAAP
ncbi:unnamed protein product [Effrenium voratum]|nr:unnamed protein product [Effrenium voratum]